MKPTKPTIFGTLLCALMLSISPIMGSCHKEVNLKKTPGKNEENNPSKPTNKINAEVFNILNLDAPGLSKVKDLHAKGKDTEAAKALLTFYQNRTGVVLPDLNLTNIKLTAMDKMMAEESLEHKFYAHKGYQPSYFYGNDINWEYWPVQDNELRWQLHRHKWFIPLGKSYRVTGDEKYAKAWVDHFMDWIRKNPKPAVKLGYEDPGRVDQHQNARFAWRPLEVSTRLEDQPTQFMLFLNSPSLTPEFLSEFLVNYDLHAKHIMDNFSAQGNHLLFEAQRLIYAGAFFPEYKQAEKWRKTGVKILNDEMKVQVLNDGMQFELDFGYHQAAIGIFFKGIDMAKANGFGSEFPSSYLETIEKMITVTYNAMFPNYGHAMFSDNKENSKSAMLRNYKRWSVVYPDNEELRYMATEGKSGTMPQNLSSAFKDSGFFVMRNGWTAPSTMMILKAGPPAFWHNQPDNGTFELYIKGRNFFPDSGCYVYAGDGEIMEQRNWHRQTRVHNTLTLDSQNITTTDSKCKLWKTDGMTDILVTENQGYSNLKHRRSVFFVDRKFYVIVDEAVGNAAGTVNLNYALCEGDVNLNLAQNGAYTSFADNNNVSIQTFSPSTISSAEQTGWVSYIYNKRQERKSYQVNAQKSADKTIRYITIITPTTTGVQAAVTAKFKDADYNANSLSIQVTVDGQTQDLSYSF